MAGRWLPAIPSPSQRTVPSFFAAFSFVTDFAFVYCCLCLNNRLCLRFWLPSPSQLTLPSFVAAIAFATDCNFVCCLLRLYNRLSLHFCNLLFCNRLWLRLLLPSASQRIVPSFLATFSFATDFAFVCCRFAFATDCAFVCSCPLLCNKMYFRLLLLSPSLQTLPSFFAAFVFAV